MLGVAARVVARTAAPARRMAHSSAELARQSGAINALWREAAFGTGLGLCGGVMWWMTVTRPTDAAITSFYKGDTWKGAIKAENDE